VRGGAGCGGGAAAGAELVLEGLLAEEDGVGFEEFGGSGDGVLTL
jgi:hypothetical protein